MEKNLLFKLSKILGLYPFDRNGDQSKSLARYSIIFNTVNMLCVTAIMVHPVNLERYKTERKISDVLGVLKIVIHMVAIVYHGVKVITDAKEIDFICKMLTLCNNGRSFKANVDFVLWQFVFDLTETVCFLIRKFYDNATILVFLRNLTYAHLDVFNSLIIMQNVALARATFLVTKSLAELPVDDHTVKRHWILRRVCEKIESFYGVSILLIVIQEFTVITQILSLIVVDIAKGVYFRKTPSLNVFSFLMSIKIPNFTMKLMVMVYYVEQLKNESMTTLYLNCKPTVEFTAAKLFLVDYPMSVAFMSAIATYFVIIVQMDINKQ